MKLNLIMPMGGGGTRFGNHGFSVPKPLIEIHGKPFFYWATQSIVRNIEVGSLTFIVLKEHVAKFRIDEHIREYYPQSNIQVIPHVLNGAVLTCMEGVKDILDGEPILFNDCDHAFSCKGFKDFIDRGYFREIDGALLTFLSDDSRYSFVKFDGTGKVCGTVEKEVASKEAICGAYYFKDKAVFLDAVHTYLSNCDYNEYFVSGVYNEMVKRNRRIRTFKTDIHISFGTPDEFNEALNNKELFDDLMNF